jgi:tripartite-type tricarboxylate transporter receptor subunit TctC
MKLARRKFLHLAACSVALPATSVSGIATAQTYPVKPVRIMAGYPAGGTTDILARLIGQWLSERLGQSFIIENRAGAGGTIAVDSLVRAPPDGYTLLLTATNDAYSEYLYPDLRYNYVRDIAPVATISLIPAVLEVNQSFKTVPDFVAYAKANPGKLNMGSGGIGTPDHLAGELFKTMAGANMIHVPYRGAAPAIADLIAGQVQVMFGTMPASIEQIRAGKLRALAVTTGSRRFRCPCHRAGFSPDRWPFTLAQSRIFSIGPRTRLAVSFLWPHTSRICITSPVSTSLTGSSPMIGEA